MAISRIMNWIQHRNYPPALFRSINTYLIIREYSKSEPKSPFWFSFNTVLIIVISYCIPNYVVIREGLITCTLTALAVLAGFLISLMLYTGHTQNITSLNYKNADAVASSIRFLLRFQLTTFLIYIFTILYGLLWFVFININSKIIIETIFIAGMFCSVIFSAILPFQLYEVHEYIINCIIKEKKNDARKKFDSARKEIDENSRKNV